MTDDQIREVFLANGFEIKPGLDDLKPYVYSAARALLAKAAEEKAYRIEIRRLHIALRDTADALAEAASSIAFYGKHPYQKGWEEGAEAAKDAAINALSVAMSGVQPE